MRLYFVRGNILSNKIFPPPPFSLHFCPCFFFQHNHVSGKFIPAGALSGGQYCAATPDTGQQTQAVTTAQTAALVEPFCVRIKFVVCSCPNRIQTCSLHCPTSPKETKTEKPVPRCKNALTIPRKKCHFLFFSSSIFQITRARGTAVPRCLSCTDEASDGSIIGRGGHGGDRVGRTGGYHGERARFRGFWRLSTDLRRLALRAWWDAKVSGLT